MTLDRHDIKRLAELSDTEFRFFPQRQTESLRRLMEQGLADEELRMFKRTAGLRGKPGKFEARVAYRRTPAGKAALPNE